MDASCTSKKASLLVSSILDNVGYSNFDVQTRQAFYTKVTEVLKPIIMVGSKREGLTNVFEGDFDQLRFDNSFPAVEDHRMYSYAVGKMSFESCSPGYTMLFVCNRERPPVISAPVFRSIMPFDDSRYYVSSSLFLKQIDVHSQNITETVKLKPAGPSVPHEFKFGLISYDYVFTLRCHCPAILNNWYSRPRRHEWPTKETRQRVVSCGANLVPHGCEGDMFSEHEWRICFNLGEIELMKSLNVTLTKVYILLKLFKKDVVKPQNKELTSFLLKNVVLWISELNPQSAFTEDRIYYWFRKALHFTRHSVMVGFLPYYMIPTRNLLRGRLNSPVKTMLIKKLSAAIRIGPDAMFYLRKPQIGLALQKYGKLKQWGLLRKGVESLMYKFVLSALKEVKKIEKNDEEASIFEYIPPKLWDDFKIKYLKTVLPDLNQMLSQGKSFSEIIDIFWYRCVSLHC